MEFLHKNNIQKAFWEICFSELSEFMCRSLYLFALIQRSETTYVITWKMMEIRVC